MVDDRAVFSPELWYLPRNGHPDGGLISSAREQLRYARFHMGDGRAADGTPLLTPASLQAMRANPGPGGTLVAELDGFGVSFGLRRTAEGVRVAMHGGSWAGQYSGFFFVPERDFAMTMLTNSDGGIEAAAGSVLRRLGAAALCRVAQSPGRAHAAYRLRAWRSTKGLI